MSKDSVTVSIIMVSYNEVDYIRTAIDSCLGQTLQDIELIIGDDGSDDGSFEIIKEYADKDSRVSYFVMDRPERFEYGVIGPLRVSDILKKGLKRAQGKYISFISADDYYVDMDKFHRETMILEKNPKIVSCFSNYKDVWDDGKEEVKSVTSNNKLYRNNYLFWGSGYCHLSAYVTRSFVFATDKLLERLCDDSGLQYLILRNGKCYCDDEITFAYRQRSESVMHKHDELALAILEIMLFQDIRNRYGVSPGTGARFFRPLRYCMQNRKDMENEKYARYFYDSQKYGNDMIGLIRDFDKSNIFRKCGWDLFYCYVAACRIIYRVILKILRLNPE